MEKHICKVCGRSFPTGRSLGSHMKTHVVLSSLMDDNDKPAASIYDLKDNPKKSRRFEDLCPEKEKDELHAKRAKVCSSFNNSFEMARDELKHDEEDDLWSGGSYYEQAEKMPSHSNYDVSSISMSVRKKRRTPRKVTKNSLYSGPPALSPVYENEEMNGALCLLMLSRGTRSITDIQDEIPPIPIIERGKKVQYSYASEDKDQPFKKPNVSHVQDVGQGSSSKLYDFESGMNKSCKSNKHVCTTCDKSFPSYQALGGHRTSHKKMKGANNKESINQVCNSQTIGKSPENFRSYKCSICGKAFPTGQALGGHKRSHSVEGNNST